MKSEALSLIPQPQRISLKSGHFTVPARWACTEPGTDARISKALARVLPRGVPAGLNFEASLSLKLVPNLPGSKRVTPEILAETYTLDITPAGVVIQALEPHGLFNGIQTLGQIIAQFPKKLPGLSIVDWPDMTFRGVHYMMGGGTRFTVPHLARMIETLARYKINDLMFEYDSEFPWKNHPSLPSSTAFTREEITSLVGLAKDNFMEITPLLDSLGHASPYICRKEYAHLAENRDANNALIDDTMCPRHPGTLQLMKEVWQEVLELHPDARYANITGDEVTLARTCPRCKSEHSNAGIARLFTDYYTPLIRWIREQGKIPMIWGDMLIKHPEDLARFPRDVIVCDWCYEDIDKPWWKLVHWHTSMDGSFTPERQKLFAPYWHKKLGDKKFVPYPYTRFFMDQGFPVIGATCARYANNKRFAMTVKENKGLGLLVTFWDQDMPPETSWFGFLAGAEYAWHSRNESRADYSRRFARTFLGLPEAEQDMVAQLDSDLAGTNVDSKGFFVPLWPESRVAKNILACARKAAAKPGLNLESRKLFALTAEKNLIHKDAGALFNRIDRLTHAFRNFASIDLRQAANSDIEHAIPKAADPLQVSAGKHTIAGVPFKIIAPAANKGKSVIYLKGKRRPEGPESVGGIPMGRKLDRLYVLLTAFDVVPGAHIADLALNLANGERVLLPIKDGVSLSDWRRGGTPLTRGAHAWSMLNQHAYMCWFDNPVPDQEVRSLDIVSTGTIGYPIILAATAAWAMTAACRALPSPKRTAIAALTKALARIGKEAPRIDAGHLSLFKPMLPQVWHERLAKNTRVTAHVVAWLDIYRQRLRELTRAQS